MNGLSRILALSPHPDDAELGAGGTMARYAAAGATVHVAVFSMPELRPDYEAAHDRLGVSACTPMEFPRREFHAYRQRILDSILNLVAIVRPDLVLVPSGQDMHQDHQVIYAEGLRACKHTSILGYELPWNHVTFTADAFIRFDGEAMDRKTEALAAYTTQQDRPYFRDGYMQALARVRGGQVGADYAEAFSVIRMTW